MKHVLLTLGMITSALYTCAQTGTVADFRKISETTGNLSNSLNNQGMFGFVAESKNQSTILSGAPFDGNGSFYRIELDADGEAANDTKISALDFAYFDGFSDAQFGTSVLELDDQNGDGKTDYLVGAPGIQPTGVLCLLLSNSGSYTLSELVLPSEMTGSTQIGAFLAQEDDHIFITSMTGAGVIFECSLNANHTLGYITKIDGSDASLTGKLDDGDRFGSGLSIVDLNNDGITDIVCGAPGDDDQDTNFGAVYQLFRNAAGDVTSVQKLSRLEGDFGGFMNIDDEFGISVRSIGDLDENGAVDLAVGAPGDDDGGTDIGAVWILFMRPNGTVQNEKKINRLDGNFSGDINYDDRFGTRIATIGDHNGDGTIDFVSGSVRDDDGGTNKGAVFTIFIERCPAPSGLFEYENVEGSTHFSAEGGTSYSYIWNFDDGGYSEQQNPVHTYESSGNYWVCLAINNDCGGNNFCQYVSVSVTATGIEDAQEATFHIYPNPSSELIEIESEKPVTKIRFTTITGQLFLEVITPQEGQKIDVSSFPTGLYLAEIWINGKRIVKKFQKIER